MGAFKHCKDVSLFNCIFLILTYGCEYWVITERVSSQVQVAQMGFLRRVNGVTLRNKVCSYEICKALNVESLF